MNGSGTRDYVTLFDAVVYFSKRGRIFSADQGYLNNENNKKII